MRFYYQRMSVTQTPNRKLTLIRIFLFFQLLPSTSLNTRPFLGYDTYIERHRAIFFTLRVETSDVYYELYRDLTFPMKNMKTGRGQLNVRLHVENRKREGGDVGSRREREQSKCRRNSLVSTFRRLLSYTHIHIHTRIWIHRGTYVRVSVQLSTIRRGIRFVVR